jgi:hypothetical protein
MVRANEKFVHWNWIAIFSYAGSLAVSLAIWTGLFRALGHLLN